MKKYVLQTLPPKRGFQITPNWPKIEEMTMTLQFLTWRHRQTFFTLLLFPLSILVTGLSFFSILSMIPESGQFSFIRNWTEILEVEIPPSEFCSKSGDWDELEIPNLAPIFLIKCYWMLQDARVTVLKVSELIREIQQVV